MHNHLINQINNRGLKTDDTLYVIGVCSNPVRYHSRYRLAREWMEAMAKTPHVQVCVVETAYGDRCHEVTEENNPWHLQLRSDSEIWIKENMINLGVRHLLPKHWKYLAWVDMDVFFRDPYWALETVHQLQHANVVQPWSDALDLGPTLNILEHHKSFSFIHSSRIKQQRHPGEPYKFGHPGFAWACTRRFWENVGGLMDFPILGSSDHHMAWCLVGEPKTSVHAGMSEGFKRRCAEWSQKAMKATQGHLGFTMGHLEHRFHGPKKRRYYRERWQILIDHGFDPDLDLCYDSQGLLKLVGKPKLEQAIQRYNRSRFEDSIEES